VRGFALEDAPRSGFVAPTALNEPVLWPAEIYGDHFMLELDTIGTPVIIGEKADSGFLVLDASEEADDAPVFWVPRKFASEPPTRVADSLADFLIHFCQVKLCLSELCVVRRASRAGGDLIGWASRPLSWTFRLGTSWIGRHACRSRRSYAWSYGVTQNIRRTATPAATCPETGPTARLRVGPCFAYGSA